MRCFQSGLEWWQDGRRLTLSAAARQPRFAVRAALPVWLVVVAYAVAMAYVESAAVLYLRTIYGGIDPVGPRHTVFNPLPDFVWVEIGREAATMIMLLAVGLLAGRGVWGKIGAFVLAMGAWDIFYYLFLLLFAGWPSSLWATDVLFLIPLPWWGPVIAPIVCATVMVVAGAAIMARQLGDGLPRPSPEVWLAVVVGSVLCLSAFMLDASVASLRGLEAAYEVRAGPFPWPMYLAGLALAVVGLWRGLLRAQEAA
jgi:hypothetical protein